MMNCAKNDLNSYDFCQNYTKTITIYMISFRMIKQQCKFIWFLSDWCKKQLKFMISVRMVQNKL